MLMLEVSESGGYKDLPRAVVSAEKNAKTSSVWQGLPHFPLGDYHEVISPRKFVVSEHTSSFARAHECDPGYLISFSIVHREIRSFNNDPMSIGLALPVSRFAFSLPSRDPIADWLCDTVYIISNETLLCLDHVVSEFATSRVVVFGEMMDSKVKI